MSEQKIIWLDGDYKRVEQYITEREAGTVFLVCDGAFDFLKVAHAVKALEQRGIKVVKFDGFTPNPRYEEVVAGVELFRKENCGMILAIGGGSAIDVAKCVKLYSNMDAAKNYLEQTIEPNTIPFIAMPTTAGTGSEATRYAVIYYSGEKQSVAHESCVPDVALMDSSALQTLPLYQKKATMLDALCHAIESFWSVNSTESSRAYSAQAISRILNNVEAYLQNEEQGCREMLIAANIAGKAINITQTTAGHAMCYKLTSLYGIAHGHAAALCVAALWPYMLQSAGKCIDPRGSAHLKTVWKEIAVAMGKSTSEQAVEAYLQLLKSLELEIPEMKETDYSLLKKSVNPVRLKNNPVELTEEKIEELYRSIAEMREKR